MNMFVERVGDIPPVTFDKLVFNRHLIAKDVIELKKKVGDLGKVLDDMSKTTHAKVDFPNGYSVSVVCGSTFYSNGVDTYECAVAKDCKMIGDVLPNQSWLDVEKLLAKYQGYDCEYINSDGVERIIYKKQTK